MVKGRQRDFDTLVPLAIKELNKEDVDKAIAHVYKLYDL